MSHAAGFVSGTTFRDLPEAVLRQTRRSLLDLIGVAAAGSMTPLSAIVRGHALGQFGARGRGTALFFDGRRVSPAGAALANAMTIDAFDAHDGHPLAKGHAGCALLPAIAAVAQAEADVLGAEFLTLLAVGCEVGIRAGIALHATACDYHASGAWSAVASAAVASRMLGLDPARIREAMGIAEYHGPRSQMMRCIDHPTMVKDGSGWGAMAGVSAAFLARDGFTGAPAVTVEADEVAHVWDDLGTRWRATEQYFKPYPVCRWAQPAIEAALQVMRDHAPDPGQIAGVTVHSFHEACRLATAAPGSTEAAQYSLPFPLAAALLKGRVGAAETTGAGLADLAVLRLSRAVRLVEDAEYNRRFPAERWARVDLHLAGGTVLRSAPAVARGGAENPLEDAELSAKFHDLMAAAGLGERAAEIEELVGSLDRLPSVMPLLEAITRAPEGSLAKRASPSMAVPA